MDLLQLASLQRAFDERHGWVPRADDATSAFRCLQEDTIGLAGELGEIANVVKRIALEANRGEDLAVLLSKSASEIEEEVTDCFIYLMRMTSYLNIDLERSFRDKLQRNEVRFARFTNQ